MTDLVTALAADSTNDGSGPDLAPTPPQISNAVDDLLLLQCSTSRNAGNGSAPTVNTPAGWTLQYSEVDNELRTYVFSKQSTGGESFPTLTSVGTASEWTCVSVVVTDVDYVNGPFGDSAGATGGGDQNSPNLTFTTAGAASLVLSFFGLERRSLVGSGFRASGTDAVTKLLASARTGGGEGVDNLSAIASSFYVDPTGTFDGPFWEASGGGDSIAFNIEVITLANIVPVRLSVPPSEPLPSGSSELDDEYLKQMIAQNEVLPDGSPAQIWAFDASLANIGTNEITVTSHSMDESTVVYVSANGGTLPTGLNDNEFYFVRPTSTNTIQLVPTNPDTDSVADLYANNVTLKDAQSLTASGSGNCLLIEARCINAPTAPLDIYRPGNGNISNKGSNPGKYIGDSGYNQNWLFSTYGFATNWDATDQTFFSEFLWVTNGRVDEGFLFALDGDGDWASWKFYDRSTHGDTLDVDAPSGDGRQFQFDKSSVLALATHQQGTFDATNISHIGVFYRGNNAATGRPSNMTSTTQSLLNALTASGGTASAPATLAQITSEAEAAGGLVSQPSDLQFTYLQPLSLGDGSGDLVFVDTEKSLAFPPLADGVTRFENYLDALGVTINLSAASSVEFANSQIGASGPFAFDVLLASGAAADLTGNTYVFGTATLDSDASYIRQLFVGGEGVTDNGATITASTFIVNNQIGADNGMVTWNGSTAVSSSTFEAASTLTTGHAIIIETPGTYTFTSLTFAGFGADDTVTAAVYNNSGGAVTLNISNGSVPTVRNGVGATTNVIAGASITLTGLIANSEVRLYRGTIANAATAVEIDGVENSGTSVTLTHSDAGQAAYIVVASVNYENSVITFTSLPATNQEIPVQQRFDRNYTNP